MVNSVIPYFGNPLKGEDGKPAHCAFRWIIRVDGLYHEFDEGYYDGKWQIFTRTSSDGIVFGPKIGPLFPAGEPGSYDEKGQADPTVLIEDGLWRMWFDAMNGSLYWDQLGYATSEDGFHWINHGSMIPRGKEGEWDAKSIHHPVVLKHDKYYLYYSGCKDDVYNVKDIGLAISEDGLTWTKIKDPVIPHGKQTEWDDRYVRPSKPIFIDGLWNMFYWGYNGIHSMGLAVSDDLIHWRKCGMILPGPNEHSGITASMPIDDEQGRRIYYATFDDIRIRMARVE